MHFAVIAGGLIPICAKDLSTPDRPRLETLVEAIINCDYSAHDFSRYGGKENSGFARFNMPLEMGMSLFHAIVTQRKEHRCSFFVSTPFDYTSFVSDLAGLDPKCYYEDEYLFVTNLYEWLRDVVPHGLFNLQPSIEVKEKYKEFKYKLGKVNGGEQDGRPSHNESQELMYTICSDCGWWQWRTHPFLKLEFPSLPLS
jgi:hypothetical protein